MRFHEVRRADRFDDGLLPVVESDRTCSANGVIGHTDDEVLDLEAGPDRIGVRYPDDGVLTHANHFETDAGECLNEYRCPNTLYRGERLHRLISADSDEIDL